jgi:hypothetical protein
VAELQTKRGPVAVFIATTVKEAFSGPSCAYRALLCNERVKAWRIPKMQRAVTA